MKFNKIQYTLNKTALNEAKILVIQMTMIQHLREVDTVIDQSKI